MAGWMRPNAIPTIHCARGERGEVLVVPGERAVTAPAPADPGECADHDVSVPDRTAGTRAWPDLSMFANRAAAGGWIADRVR